MNAVYSDAGMPNAKPRGRRTVIPCQYPLAESRGALQFPANGRAMANLGAAPADIAAVLLLAIVAGTAPG
jgi:hypothetical protein